MVLNKAMQAKVAFYVAQATLRCIYVSIRVHSFQVGSVNSRGFHGKGFLGAHARALRSLPS